MKDGHHFFPRLDDRVQQMFSPWITLGMKVEQETRGEGLDPNMVRPFHEASKRHKVGELGNHEVMVRVRIGVRIDKNTRFPPLAPDEGK